MDKPGVLSTVVFVLLALILIPIVTYLMLHSSEITRLITATSTP